MAGIYLNDFDVVNSVLVEMYQTSTFNEAFFESRYVHEFFNKHESVLINFTALLTKFSSITTNSMYFNFIYNWLTNTEQINQDAVFNLLIIYVQIANMYFDDWELESEVLELFLPPESLLKLNKYQVEVDFQLNFNLMMINYFSQKNNKIEIELYFKKIEGYLKSKEIKMENAVRIALFYNHWSLFYNAIDLLKPYFEKNLLNSEGIMILASTITLNPSITLAYKSKVFDAAMLKSDHNGVNGYIQTYKHCEMIKLKIKNAHFVNDILFY